MDGYIHSQESFGAVDGPGIRFVVFLQGCSLRCKYCHNPDTWKANDGTKVSAQSIIDKFNKNRAFYVNGGITVSGGEPLLQIDFLTELFKLAKLQKIHTCIDTSGAVFDPHNTELMQKLDILMEYTDLILLDIKHIDEETHRYLTGKSGENIKAFARYLDHKGIDVWIRHVIVPTICDDSEHLQRLGEFIASLGNVKAIEAIAYHTMGVEKYRQMGIEYPLEGIEPHTKAEFEHAKAILLNAYANAKASQ